MKKLLFTLAALFATSTISAAEDTASAEVPRLQAEIRHLESQINKNVNELGKLKERLAIATTHAYIERKNGETRTLGDIRRSERGSTRSTRAPRATGSL